MAGKAAALELDFDITPSAKRQDRKQRLIWNRCYAHTNRNALNEEYATGRHSLIVPAYSFDKAAGEKAAEAMQAVALTQGRVEFKDHSVDNPTRQNEIVATFFSPKGLDVLRDAAEQSLGSPFGPTKNRACVQMPALDVMVEEDSIVMTGATRWIGDYMPMCKGEVKASVINGVTHTKVVFPLEEKEFVITSLNKFTTQMGYQLNCSIEV